MKTITENNHTIQISKSITFKTGEDGRPEQATVFNWDVTIPPGKIIGSGQAETAEAATEAGRKLIPEPEDA